MLLTCAVALIAKLMRGIDINFSAPPSEDCPSILPMYNVPIEGWSSDIWIIRELRLCAQLTTHVKTLKAKAPGFIWDFPTVTYGSPVDGAVIGWPRFYYLHLISGSLFTKKCYKHVIKLWIRWKRTKLNITATN